jgi:hypothetical protein
MGEQNKKWMKDECDFNSDKRLNGKQIRDKWKRKCSTDVSKTRWCRHGIIKMPQIVSNFWGMFISKLFLFYFRVFLLLSPQQQ